MKRTITDLEDIKGKKILVRCDFNVPLDHWGDILDDARITATIPTISYLSERGAKLILCSHLGRPNGYDKFMSLFPVAVRLMKQFPNKVRFCNKIIGKEVNEAIDKLQNGEILVLENLRFNPGEETNDPKFVKELASLADIYVNDAFGASHRKHASTYGVPLKMPSAIGFLVQKELSVFETMFDGKDHPFVSVFGGAKVSDKLALIENALKFSDCIIIGGGMAYTFMQAQGIKIGKSIVQTELVPEAERILKKAEEKGVKVYLPVDHRVITEGGKIKTVRVIEKDMTALDIGPNTARLFSMEIVGAKKVMWNGPMGKYEDAHFKRGTFAIAKACAKCSGFTVVGGGDSISAVKASGVAHKINHLSTGGGASMKLMEGKVLPAIEVIDSIKKS